METLHYLLMVNHLMFRKTLLSNLRDTTLTIGQPKVLDYLRDHDGACQKEIAAACQIEPASITSVLLGMENKGLVVRRMLNGDRRSLYVYLTDTGKAFAKRIGIEFDNIERKALAGFTDDEKQLLNALMTRMNINMKEKRDGNNG
jgi:DNA-binding MarR family transcriptional regulator